MVKGNTNDRKREEASRPNAGSSEERHKHKDNRSDSGHSGVTLHPEKAAYDQKRGKSGLSQPNAGPHDRGKDPKNSSKPEGGSAPVPREHLHSEKTAADDAKTYEPKAKGKYLTGESTTKVKAKK